MSQSSHHASSTVPVAHDPSLTDEHMGESGGDAAHFPRGEASQPSVPTTIVVDSSIAQTVPVDPSQIPSMSRVPLGDTPASSSHRFTPSVIDALEERSQAGSFVGFPPPTEVQGPGSQSEFVSRREALSVAQSMEEQSAATSRELATVREQIAHLHSQASLGVQNVASRQDQMAAQMGQRVAQSVAQFEQIGAQTEARATQAQTSSAAALQTAQQATAIGTQAHSVASQAHSTGSEAIRRTQELTQKQAEDVQALREQLASLRNTQTTSNDLIRQVQAALEDTRQQLKASQQNVTNLHGQVQAEQTRVADLERQLNVEKTKTADLTSRLQQVQVDAAAQVQTQGTTAGGTGGTQGIPNPELTTFLEQQRELLLGYQHLARLQSSQQASTSAAAAGSGGARLQIQMRPKEPPVFTGKKDQDVDIWLHQVDDYFALTKPTDADGVAYLVLMLQGFARDWWEAEIKAAHGRYPASIEEMKMLLKAAFSSPLRERKARAEIRNLRQGQNEDYREYAARFKSLLARIPPGSYSDAVAMDDWIFGLTPPYGERVMALKPRTLNEAIATMGELDIAHQFCRRDGGRNQGKTGGGDQKTGNKGKQQKGAGGNPQQASTSGHQSQSVGKQGNKNKSQGKTQSYADKSKLQCYYCGAVGHKKSECRKFARDQKAKIGTLQAQLAAARAQASQGAAQQAARQEDQPSRKN